MSEFDDTSKELDELKDLEEEGKDFSLRSK